MSREKRLEKAQMRVLFQVPFFAPGVAKLPVDFDKSVDTACTDGERIKFNPDFFDKCKDQELVTVLCHEVCHCLLGHIWRIPPDKDWEKWNQATDHAVNNMLKEFGEQVTSKRLADPFPFPDGQWCMDPAFKGLSEEEIYSRMPKGNGGGSGQKPGKGKPGQGSGSGSKPSIGQIAPGNPGQDPAQAKKVKSDWDHTLMQCAQAVKARGDLPGAMSSFIGELLNPTVPWWEIVRNWLREQCEDDWNFMKPNKFYDDSGFILPSLHSERIGPIVFATDTSGSIDDQIAAHFRTEKQACLDDLKPSALLDIQCDTRIQKVTEYKPGDEITGDIHGRGGTSFCPVFEHVSKLQVAPKCLVYLTDLDGTFPDTEPDYPVLWVAYGGGTKAPFGEIVQAS